MLIVTGIIALLVGLLALGQLISVVDFELAQQLGLQEKADETDPLFRRLELNTAWWDQVVLWLLPLAGVLMLMDHSWWPYVALVAGGVYVDAAGREAAKWLGLGSEGIRTGAEKAVRVAMGAFSVMFVTGLWVIVYAVSVLA
jgi:hypothetical protein